MIVAFVFYLVIVKKFINVGHITLTPVYSPLPEYPAACWSETEIPPSGAAGMKGKVNRAEARQSGGGLG